MLTPLIRNERRKLLATACNNLGIAFMVTGLIAPGAAYLLGTLPVGNVWRPVPVMLIYGAIGILFMLAGHRALRELE